LVLANGFFVATEFAIVGVRRSRLEELVSKGDHSAKRALDVITHLDIYIAACQLGITMASLALGWIGEPALAEFIEPAFSRLFGSLAPAIAHTTSIAVAFTVITVLHIIAGELAPKGLALQKTEKTALWVAGPIRIFYRIFQWPTKLLNNTGSGLLRILGLKPASSAETVHSLGEIQVLLKGMQQEGVIGEKEVDCVVRVFRTAEREVRDIMTPRTSVVYLDKGITVGRFLEFN
jgi:CBS domain containing-hemolysin-like protein